MKAPASQNPPKLMPMCHWIAGKVPGGGLQEVNISPLHGGETLMKLPVGFCHAPPQRSLLKSLNLCAKEPKNLCKAGPAVPKISSMSIMPSVNHTREVLAKLHGC